jgi:hypothetical protein
MLRMELSDKFIKKNSVNMPSFARGLELCRNGRVEVITADESHIEAIVHDGLKFAAGVSETKDGLINMHCECMDFAHRKGICKHLAAAMKAHQQKQTSAEGFNIPSSSAVQKLLGSFAGTRADAPKRALNLEYTIEIIDWTPNISLRVGEGRLYMVKSMKTFLDAVKTGKTVYFGKNFTFDPETQSFSELDKSVLALLNEYSALSAAGSYYYNYYDNPKFQKLGELGFSRLMAILDKISVNIGQRNFPNLPIKHHTDPDIALDFKETRDGVAVTLRFEENIYRLCKNAAYIIYQNHIYQTTPEWQNYMPPFMEAVIASATNTLLFRQDTADALFRDIVPRTIDSPHVHMGDSIRRKIVKTAPVFKVYLDKAGNGIKASVKAQYGEDTFALPDTNATLRNKDGKIILRDTDAENEWPGA